jgi:Otopetrin
LSRFGLAHLVATDICVWIRTLLDETVHEFTQLKQKQIKEKGGNMSESDLVVTAEEVQAELEGQHLMNTAEGFLSTGYRSDVCVDGDSMMHEMLETASVFLYPCMIEYALITAGIVYIMWQSVSKPHPVHSDADHSSYRRHPRMFSVDCSHSANGLFAGILMIVLTIVGLIFYFLYINSTVPGSDIMAGLCADILDVSLNTVGLTTVVYCAVQFCRKLHRVNVHNANMELDDGLLILTMVMSQVNFYESWVTIPSYAPC